MASLLETLAALATAGTMMHSSSLHAAAPTVSISMSTVDSFGIRFCLTAFGWLTKTCCTDRANLAIAYSFRWIRTRLT